MLLQKGVVIVGTRQQPYFLVCIVFWIYAVEKNCFGRKDFETIIVLLFKFSEVVGGLRLRDFLLLILWRFFHVNIGVVCLLEFPLC